MQAGHARSHASPLSGEICGLRFGLYTRGNLADSRVRISKYQTGQEYLWTCLCALRVAFFLLLFLCCSLSKWPNQERNFVCGSTVSVCQ